MSMTVIQHTELGSAQSSITFSSIPQTYTDLYLVISARSTGSATGIYFAFNGSTSNFSGRFLQGSGSSTNSASDARRAGYCTGTDQTANTLASNAIYIPNYTSSVAKSYSVDHVQENNATTSYQGIFAGLWDSTATISTIAITNPTGDMAAGSSATLYGILKGSNGGVTVS